MNTHETYVSQELAVKMIHAGFAWNEYLVSHQIDLPFEWEIPLHIAQKWLRDVQGIDITVSFCKHDFDSKIEKAYFNECEKITEEGVIDYTDNAAYFHTYEEALENGIEVAVNALMEEIDKQ